MDAGLGHSRRHARHVPGVCALVVTALIAAHQAGWPARGHRDPRYRLLSRAQAERCLNAHGLQVTPVGTRSLQVTLPAHPDVTLTFYATVEQAQAVNARWVGTPRGEQLIGRRGAIDTVTFRASRRIDDADVRLLGGCVGRQPVPASA
jgi:hypothetical protein